MASDIQKAPVSKPILWAGYIMSALPVLGLLMSAIMKFVQPEEMIQGFTKLGWHQSQALGLGILELACTVIYAIPRTSVLGAILLTGYMGGAIATHVRLGEQFAPQVILGVLIWGGLWLRDARIRALLPVSR